MCLPLSTNRKWKVYEAGLWETETSSMEKVPAYQHVTQKWHAVV